MEYAIDLVASVKIFSVVMGLIGLAIGLGLLVNAQGMVRFSRALDKWVSVEQVVEKIDRKLLDLDSWMLKNNAIAAVLFILLAILALSLGILSH